MAREPSTPQSSTSAAAALLRGAALRRTPVRVAVLDVLSVGGSPMGVPQILAKLPGHTDAVTVYRTLNTFTRKKLVHRVRGEDRTWRYALSSPRPLPEDRPHPHPHFVCEACGAVECMEEAELPRNFIRSLRVDAQYEVHYSEVLLHGVCPRCQ